MTVERWFITLDASWPLDRFREQLHRAVREGCFDPDPYKPLHERKADREAAIEQRMDEIGL